MGVSEALTEQVVFNKSMITSTRLGHVPDPADA